MDKVDAALNAEIGPGWTIGEVVLSDWKEIPQAPHVVQCTFSGKVRAEIDRVRAAQGGLSQPQVWVIVAGKGKTWQVTGLVTAEPRGDVWKVSCSLDPSVDRSLEHAQQAKPATGFDSRTIFPNDEAALASIAEARRQKAEREAALQRERDRLFQEERAAKEAQRAKEIANATSVFLCDLSEMDDKVGWGAFGKGTQLGYPVAANHEMIAGGSRIQHGLSMVPVARSHATVSYLLPPGFTRMAGAAAVLDGSTPATDIIFTILCDGREVWRSVAINATNRRQNFEIVLPSAQRLELRTACQGAISGAHAFWIDPQLIR